MANEKPAHTSRIGSVKATIWRNTSEEGGQYFTVKVSKTYKDKDGNLQDGDNFREADLLNVAKVCERAGDWLAAQE